MIYLLAESHLSNHTFVDEDKITLDSFTCSLGVEYEKIKSIIKVFFMYVYWILMLITYHDKNNFLNINI